MKKTFLLLGLIIAMFAGVQAQMVLVFDTNLDDGTTINLPLDGTVNVTVDWGDGNTESFTTIGLKEHTYATEGEYTVQINGTLTTFGINDWPNLKLKRVTSFGEIGITNLNFAFKQATNLIEIPATLPPNVTNLYSAFWANSTFNLDITNWDVSNVTDFYGVFYGTNSFNQNIGGWDVSNGTGFAYMFSGASSFNQDISNWNMSNAANMFAMFRSASSFNQNLGSWNISNVIVMTNIFNNITLSTENYDAILVGWSQQSLNSGLNLHGGNSKYSCVGEAARNQIINNFGWTITDGGLQADNVAPVIDDLTLPDLHAECEITSLTAPTATDNCVGSITGTHNATLPINTQGITVVTWTYDDGNGNSNSQVQYVAIDDVTAPLADEATLSDVTAECEITSLTAPTATDNCAGSIIGTHNVTLPLTASTQITWTYDDGNGNTSAQTQNVVISDAIAPIADEATLADVTTECEITSLTAPTATDNCAGSITGTHNATLPITASTQITWTYDDGNGNTGTQTQNVIISDAIAPLADEATLADVTAECEITSLTAPTATDNCAGSFTGTHNATLPLTASTQITWTYDDGNGNISTQTQNVVIDDVTAPEITCPESLYITLNEGETQYSVIGTELDYVSATDNCSQLMTSNNFDLDYGGVFPIGTYNLEWTVEDYNSHVSTCTFELVVSEYVGVGQISTTGVSVYPNPVTNTINIGFSDYLNVKIRMTDVSGRELYSANATQNNTTIDMSSHEDGVYFLHIESGSNIEIVKIIKQN